jgi:hypothetical protein
MFYLAMTESHAGRLTRARPVIALASVAFAIGAIVGANQQTSSTDTLAARFTAAWAKGDYAAMYAEIDPTSQRSLAAEEFAAAYRRALTLATATRTTVTGKPRNLAGDVEVPVHVRTRLFGTLQSAFRLKIADAGEGPRVAWSRSLAFPGMQPGEELERRTTLPRRAPLLARDGSVLAEGAAQAGQRNSPLGSVASAVLGSVGPIPAVRRAALEAEGVPPDGVVGVSGVERALDDRLRGTPGGELLAQSRPGVPGRALASAAPQPAPAVRTTISPALQRAAVNALGGQFGGIVALAPAGEVLAVAGIGLDGLQPPGSTFKMVTTTGVLQAGVATPRSTFPYRTFATLDGVKLSNANGEECGGTLAVAFASSCNSVFAPLGAKLGAARLVATAERFGFNQDPGIAGAAESTLPPAAKIQGELDAGSTAIGQGQVQASALEMAAVAATIADGGQRPRPTFLPSAPPTASVPVTSAAVARTMRRLMIGVVRAGTGTAAAIPGVTVAGKTGTAELKTATCAAGSEQGAHEAGSECGAAKEPSNTDAWFAAFAPALRPRIVVGVLLVKDGAGGETAAPVARQVLEAGLKAGG